tara:strand:- start:1494 stop:1847 length:354 start_codon:yes stop_codon:yes gene_type:complete
MQFETYKDLVMYYQTTIRNVFLSTAVSFAALGYSRFYRGKSKLYSNSLCLVSLLIIIASFSINYSLYNSLKNYIDNDKYSDINQFTIVNKLLFISHILLIFFAFYTLYRLYFNKEFK